MADSTEVPEPTRDEWDRFWSYVRNYGKEGCWTWIGGKFKNGYGMFTLRNQARRAHRVAYVWERGDPGIGLDHLCRNRACVNPAHMEPTDTRTNVLRGDGPSARNARKTHCDHGHEFTEANTWIDPGGWRQCRKCRAAASQRYRDRVRARG